jgi:murein DD-endopeptidase MepM/ murein hydrolase activator NlpD
VEGPWQVLWGGRTWEDNKHASVSDMRYALDLWVLQNGSSFGGAGLRNEDYFAWNQPALAAGSGVVVEAVDGVPDNLPNRPAPGNLYGNHVVLDHGNGEYSLTAHLAQGSVRVKRGEVVAGGQLLGRVGNSGMSTEPHLHFHLMDNADSRRAHGLPAQLMYFTRNGQLVERGEPRRGDTIAPTSVEAKR